MDLQKKFEVAVKMLEQNVCMDDLRFSSDEELVEIAEWRLHINPLDLKAFAEEVAERTVRQKAREDSARADRAECTILITDDQSALTRKMNLLTTLNEELSNETGWLDTGFKVVFRIRSEVIAKRCGRIIGRKVEATKDPLPTLKEGDMVLDLPRWQIDRGSENVMVYNAYDYIPD